MVLRDVPKSERCRCHESPRVPASTATVKADAAAEPSGALGKFKAWLKQ
jgi:hypothetical protein